jgi:predicted dehydrogenase
MATRTIASEAKRGKVIEVETPTHVVGLLEFKNGAVGQITTSFDVQATTLPCIEVYGTEGTLLVPDPNGFGGDVRIRSKSSGTFASVPLSHGFVENARGLGLFEMAIALATGKPHRAGGDLALHVVDAMQGILEAAESGSRIALSSTVDRPEAMPANPADLRLPATAIVEAASSQVDLEASSPA